MHWKTVIDRVKFQTMYNVYGYHDVMRLAELKIKKYQRFVFEQCRHDIGCLKSQIGSLKDHCRNKDKNSSIKNISRTAKKIFH